MPPSVTVIIPVYNGMPFLPETVESILSQTHQDFQLLIIDDRSTDGSQDYLKSIHDPRLDLIIHDQNQGLCQTLNEAIFNHAKSDLIARLDQDDIAIPSRLEEQLDFMKHHPNYAGVLSQISRIGATGKEFGSYQVQESQDPIEDFQLERYGFIVHSTFLFRRDKFIELGGYRGFLYPVDDADLLLRFSEKFPLALINKPLVKYRIHSQSSSFSTFWNMQTKTRYVMDMHSYRCQGLSEIPFDEWMKLEKTPQWKKLLRYKSEFGKLMFRNAGSFIGEEKQIQGALYLLFALILNPKFTMDRLLSLRKPTD